MDGGWHFLEEASTKVKEGVFFIFLLKNNN